jgi:hypothetical protein
MSLTSATPGASRQASTWAQWRRRLRRRRRPVAAALTLVAVLAAGSSLRPSQPDPPAPDGDRSGSWALPAGLVAAPIRIAEPAVAGLLTPGDVVDVVAADAQGRASVVASGAVVIWLPAADAGAFAPDPFSGAVLMVAVPASTAVAIAGATTTGQLSLLVTGVRQKLDN